MYLYSAKLTTDDCTTIGKNDSSLANLSYKNQDIVEIQTEILTKLPTFLKAHRVL